MTMRIDAVADSDRWTAYMALAHLRIDSSRLVAAVASGAAPQVVASDREAVSESSRQFVNNLGTSAVVDVTV